MFFQQCDSAEKLQQMHAFAAFKTAANSATLEGDKKKTMLFLICIGAKNFPN